MLGTGEIFVVLLGGGGVQWVRRHAFVITDDCMGTFEDLVGLSLDNRLCTHFAEK